MSETKHNGASTVEGEVTSVVCSDIILSDIISRVPVAMFAFDAEGRIVMWNRESEKLYGKTADQVVKTTLWQSIAAGEDRERIDEIVRRVFEGEILFGVEWQWQAYVDTSRNLTTIVYPAKNKFGEPQLGISVTLDYTMPRDYQREFTNETQFRSSLLNAMGVGVAVVDVHGEVLFANDTLRNMISVGKIDPCTALCDCENPQLSESPYALILKGRDRASCEMSIADRDGEEVSVSLVAAPMYGANGKLKAVVEIYTLVSKQEEQADEIKFRDIFDSLTDAAAIIGPNLRIKDVNKAFLDLYDVRKMDAINSPCYEVLRARSAPCHSDLSNYCIVKNVFRNGEPSQTRYRTNLPRAGRRTLDVTASPICGAGGELDSALVVIHDVTEQDDLFETIERAKTEWERTFDTMRDLVSIYDSNHRLLRANRALAAKLGMPVQALIGMKCHEIFYGKTESDSDSSEVRALRSGGTHHETIEDEKLGHLFTTVTPLLDKHGDPTGYIHVAHDLTEQKNLENQLQRAQRMENLGTLTSGIAHDFNNLLGGMLGYAKLAKTHAGVKERVLKDIETIEDCAQRATELTRQLLSYSRKDKPKMRTLTLDKTIRQVLRIIERTMGESIEVSTVLEDDLLPVNADEGQIHHAILNLCINARDAMPGGGRITIKAKNETLAAAVPVVDLIEDRENKTVIGKGEIAVGNYVHITVSDTGSGIDHETAEKIFDPFFTTKGENEGTGLGLAIIASTIEKHGGYVIVESRLGEGASFHLYLPEAGQSKASAPAVEEETSASGTENIMVVDDESVILSLVGDALKDAGYNLQYASSGAEAVSIINNNPGQTDLVIMDYAMPVMNGEKACEKISGLDPEIAVIIIGGYNCEGKVRELVDRGADGFLQKPFSPEQLQRTVRNALDRKKKHSRR